MTQQDDRHIEWIQADLDGQATRRERSALRKRLQADPEARRLQAGLKEVCRVLDEVGDVDPPAGLRSEILAEIRRRSPAMPKARLFRTWRLQSPVLRYGYVLAAGFALGFALHLVVFRQVPEAAPRDILGTMAAIDRSPESSSAIPMVTEAGAGIGSLELRASGSALLLGIELASPGPVELLVAFDANLVSFRGWEAPPGDGGSISAEPGLVRLESETGHRYGVLLERRSLREGALDVRALMSGHAVYHGTLRLPEAK